MYRGYGTCGCGWGVAGRGLTVGQLVPPQGPESSQGRRVYGGGRSVDDQHGSAHVWSIPHACRVYANGAGARVMATRLISRNWV